MAEALVNEIVDAQAEDSLRRRQPVQRLVGAHARHQRWRHQPAHLQTQARKLLLGGPHRALLARGRAVVATVSETVICGVSTRKVKRTAAQMGIDRMSAS